MLILVLLSAVALGQSDPRLVRVEQDWQLVVGTPDGGNSAPQITCTISPTNDIRSFHAAFELNQQQLPSYSPGGLQLQIFNGESPVSQGTDSSGVVLATPNETITWTQSMEINGSELTFQVSNGNSTTWGAFGGNGRLKANVPISLADLSEYSSDVSVRNSGVSFASNRVQSFMLLRVRYFLSTGDQYEDDTARVVYPQP